MIFGLCAQIRVERGNLACEKNAQALSPVRTPETKDWRLGGDNRAEGYPRLALVGQWIQPTQGRINDPRS